MARRAFVRVTGVAPLLALIVLACGRTGTPTSTPAPSTATPLGGAPAEMTAPPSATAASGQATAPGSATGTGTTQPAPATATVTPESLAAMGAVAAGNGAFIQALGLADPATPGVLYTAEAGRRLVAVELIAGNESAEPFDVNVLNSTLVDAEGFTYTAELGAVADQMKLVTLAPGERVRGWVAFSIPAAAQPAAIKYAPRIFGAELQSQVRAGAVAPEALPARTPPQRAKLGDVVEQGGYSLSATAVQDPAPPGLLFEPKPGMRLVAVDITVGNVSGERLTVNPLDAYLVDANGFVYGLELGGAEGQLELRDLNAGEKVRGRVGFLIPADAQPEAVKFEFAPEFMLAVGLSQ